MGGPLRSLPLLCFSDSAARERGREREHEKERSAITGDTVTGGN
jgi:hypothetical protein